MERLLEPVRFNPTPQEAVTYTLSRHITGEPLHPAIRPYLHEADIYACEPGVLAAQFQPTPRTGECFFFTTFKLQPHKAGKSSRDVRAASPGFWHSQGNTTDVKDGADVKIGEVKKFRYKKCGKFTDWLMDEFSCCSEDTVVSDRQRVLCKIWTLPRAKKPPPPPPRHRCQRSQSESPRPRGQRRRSRSRRAPNSHGGALVLAVGR